MQSTKFKKLAIKINMILAASCYSTMADAAVDIHQSPLAGVNISYAPNLVLAISVEFPTAGPAYTTVGTNNGKEIKLSEHFNRTYRGYLDPEKCYEYTGKHFTPVARSVTMGGLQGLCPGANTYSASALNFLTASALDVFRQTLTGGNRAYGTGTDAKAYQDGDSATRTFVRRSQPGKNDSAPQHNTMLERRIDLSGATAEQLNALFPKQQVQKYFKDIFDNKTGDATKKMPRAAGLRKLVDYRNFPTGSEKEYVVGDNVTYEDQKIYFTNTGFGAYAYRRVREGGNTYFAYLPDMIFPSITVEVCKAGFREDNCKEYNGQYKPEGVLHEYARKGTRVAVLGYVNDSAYGADAPVLRGRMKYLDRTETVDGIVYGQEWNPNTGQFNVNPDTTDARTSGVSNSGVMNYVNKFGDVSGYKTFDIGSELYYAALRYIRGGANGNFGKLGLSKDRAVYVRNDLDAKLKDGFPAIYNWDDPILRGLGSNVEEAARNPQAQCRASKIIYIGDTNTHNDLNLPNFESVKYKSYKGDARDYKSGTIKSGHSLVRDDIQTKDYLMALLANQGIGADRWRKVRGASLSPSGMAGVAYWARTHDVRADIPGMQRGDNFMIDVVENGTPKGQSNTYWLTAKYGGFDPDRAKEVNEKLMPIERKSWTDDPPGVSGIAGFFNEKTPYGDPGATPDAQGIPRNFGVANDPDNMAKSLKAAFASKGDFKDPSQAAIGLTVPADEKADLTAGALVLTSNYQADKMVGDLLLNQVRVVAGALQFTPQWRASTKLDADYHNTGNAWQNRKVFSKDGGSIRLLKDMSLPGAHGTALISYILGSSKDEDILWRKRGSLMGSIVHATPVSILKPTSASVDYGKCTYDPAVMNREVHYAVAANDGMFHIFDSDGDEKIAYMPSTALAKQADFADMNAGHMFLNDGNAVYLDACFGSSAKSVLIGNTGRGGSAVYALDVTNLSTPGASNILWEFSAADDADMGTATGNVAISKNNAGQPIAIFSSGYNNAGERGYLFVLDITNTGGSWQLNRNYWKIPLGSASVAGVGDPFAYDSNKDDIADNVYVGDFNGSLWRVDQQSNSTWKLANSGNAMFTPPAAQAAPITGAPFVQNVRGKIYVTFGTGQYLNEEGLGANVQNYAYGLIDDGQASTISLSDLVTQTIDSKPVLKFSEDESGNKTRSLWEVSGNAFTEGKHRGWRLKLQKGQAIVAQPVIRGGEVAEFVAVNRDYNSADVCVATGSTSILSLALRNGGSYPKPLFDTNGDHQVNDDDTKGAMVTIHGQINPNIKGHSVIVNGKSTYANLGVTDKGNFIQAGRVFREGSVLIRTTHREVPL